MNLCRDHLKIKSAFICLITLVFFFSTNSFAGVAVTRSFQETFDPANWVSATPAPNGGSFYFPSGYRGWYVLGGGQLVWVPVTGGGSVKESLTLAANFPGSSSLALVSPFSMRLADWTSVSSQASSLPRIHKQKICLINGETITLDLKFTRHYLLGGNVADPVRIFVFNGVNEQKIYEYASWVKYGITGVVNDNYAYGFNPTPYGHYLDFVTQTATVQFNLPSGFYSVGFEASRNVLDRINFSTDATVKVPASVCK
jgi:hypothetical protein